MLQAHAQTITPDGGLLTMATGLRARRGARRLADRLRRRDPDAIQELYTAHAPRVLRLLIATVGDRATAEDLLQEIFLELWRRGDRYDPARGTPEAWILTVARSRAIDHLRRRLPEPRDPEAVARAAERADPRDEVDALIERWHVAGALGRLSAEQAEVLRMRFEEGMSQSQIADAVGIPLGTVKTRMAAALRRVADLLEQTS